MSSEPTVLHLLPDDVLLIGNVRHNEGLSATLTELKKSLPSVSKVFVFADDIDVKLLREVESDG